MNTQPKSKGDYFSFSENEFHEWVTAAPTNELIERINVYITALKYHVESIDKDTDFTGPDFFDEFSGIAWGLRDLGPWIDDIHQQLWYRHETNK